jgi:hypothetical protein
VAVSRIDYLSRDYESLRTSLRQYAQDIFPDWRPGSEGDFGLVLVELFAYMGDILSYYTDRAQMENYLPTATQRESILNLAHILGYVPHSGSPATGSVSLTTVAGTSAPVVVPAGLRVATNRVDQIDGPVIFETAEAVTLPANTAGDAVPVPTDVVEGTTRTGVLLGISDGTPSQVFSLPNAGVYRETINIYIEDPAGSIVLQPDGGGPTVNVQQWLQVDRLLGETGAGRVYEARLSAAVTNVYFGDDLSGEIPATGLNIYATYRYGVGSWGNLSPGALRNVDTTGTTGLTAVRVAATGENEYQSTATTGGADEETNQSIRDNAPLAFRSQERVVTAKDFVSVALGTPGVSTAAAVLGSFTSVTMYITGPGSTAASSVLKTAVLDRLRERVLAGVEVQVLDPVFQPIDFGTALSPIVITVTEGYPPAVVDDAVRRSIVNMMAELPAETPLAASDVYAAIIGVDGVQRVAIPVITRASGATQTDTSTITPQAWEVLNVGTINLSVV